MELFERARLLLTKYYGYDDFRPSQRPVVRDILLGRDVLAVLPTGGGKSICFQIPALALKRLTVVVSPLIALMTDQVEGCRKRGIAARALTSATTPTERAAVDRELRDHSLRLLYVSPERLRALAPYLRDTIGPPGLLAIDEAHCISEWGHDFRPAFRQLRDARTALGDPPVIALTGSATPGVRRDIADSLGLGARGRRVAMHVASFDRANLWLGGEEVRDERDRLHRLLRLVPRDGSISIVYAPTRGMVDGLALALRRAGRKALAYHAGLDGDARRLGLQRFLAGELEVVVATCAFGMGIDKADVRRVVHWAMPPTPESYYQEAGRAGRDGGFARCTLLWHQADPALQRRQLDVTFPPRTELERLWRDPARLARASASIRETAERLRQELRPEDGAVDWAKLARRRQAAESRMIAMARYALGRRCRRKALLEWFGEAMGACAGCDVCEKSPKRAALKRVVARLGW